MQCSAVFMYMSLWHVPPTLTQFCCRPNTPPLGSSIPWWQCSGIAWRTWQGARGADLPPNSPDLQSGWASAHWMCWNRSLETPPRSPQDPKESAGAWCQTPQDTPRGPEPMPRWVRAALGAQLTWWTCQQTVPFFIGSRVSNIQYPSLCFTVHRRLREISDFLAACCSLVVEKMGYGPLNGTFSTGSLSPWAPPFTLHAVIWATVYVKLLIVLF